jgi:hypothetical protein
MVRRFRRAYAVTDYTAWITSRHIALQGTQVDQPPANIIYPFSLFSSHEFAEFDKFVSHLCVRPDDTAINMHPSLRLWRASLRQQEAACEIELGCHHTGRPKHPEAFTLQLGT